MALAALMLGTSASGWSQANLSPTLYRGIISYVEGGRRHQIDVGKPCSDLWVSPDGRVIAFIAVQKAEPPTPTERGSFIEESSLYIARKSDRFKPVPLDVGPVSIGGNQWTVFRNPSLSPDLRTIYFEIPDTMTTWKLLKRAVSGGVPTVLGDVMAYCVVWNGERSGDLLTMVRQDSTSGRPAAGVRYPCYLSSQAGEPIMVADGMSQSCFAFDDFSMRWSSKHGGVCRSNAANAR
jgi:hypothetical protein